jgi:predicted Rossmann fold nucleotide-binding protein DprA/Smf involved in DNA uptake
MGKRYGVTGTTGLMPDEVPIVHEVIRNLTGVKLFTTGGAYGVDTEAAIAAWKYQSYNRLQVCVPTGKAYNEATRKLGKVIEVPGGYMARNDAIVAHSDVLLAFPRTREEVVRSGTWATIRRARKAGVEVRLYPLDEGLNK